MGSCECGNGGGCRKKPMNIKQVGGVRAKFNESRQLWEDEWSHKLHVKPTGSWRDFIRATAILAAAVIVAEMSVELVRAYTQ